MVFTGAALAGAPNVATDIMPVHSLVARVMEGKGAPSLIVAPGASPHEYSLRPSEARILQEAKLVFLVTAELTPWLDGAIETLAGGATVIELLETDGTTKLPLRENALFKAHQQGDDPDSDTHDPHAWLSPDNAEIWLNAIAVALASADPDNANAYLANASAGRMEIEALKGEINTVLEPLRGGKFIVFHDSFQYFEAAFDFPASGAISLSDARDPSPARIAEIQTYIADQGVACVFAEPQFNPGIIAAFADETKVQTGVMDPLGADLEPGTGLYPQLMRRLATALTGCL